MLNITNTKQYLNQIETVISDGSFRDTWESLTDFEIHCWFTKAKFELDRLRILPVRSKTDTT